MEEQRNDDAQQDISQADPLSAKKREPAFSPNIGSPNPGSPSSEMGTAPIPPASGVGSEDPGGGADITGDEQAFDRGIVDETRTGDTGLGPDQTGQ